MKRAVQLPTVAPIKKAAPGDSLKAQLLGEMLAREAVSQAFRAGTGLRTVERIRPDGKIGLEIVRELVA